MSAQVYFNNVYLPGDNEPNVIANDSGYVVLHQNNPHIKYLSIKHFDLQGQFIKTDSIELKVFYEDCRNCLVPYAGGYLKAGTYFYADGTNEIVLIPFDKDLDTLGTYEFSWSDLKDSDVFGLKAFSKNEILVVGNHFRQATGTFSMLVTRLDSNFNVVWEKTFNRPGWNQAGGYRGVDIEKSADGGYLIGGIATRFTNLPNSGILLKTDSLGNEEWRHGFTGPEGNNEVLLHPINDSVFSFITVQRLSELATDQYWHRLRNGKVDMYGNVLKDTLIGPMILEMSTAFFEPTKDGNYITGGFAQSLGFKSYAMKFTEEGDSLWFRSYFHGNDIGVDEAWIETMAHTADSGFIFCGYFMDLGQGGRGAHTWLVKTDKYGCDTAGCNTMGSVEYAVQEMDIEIFPNPFEDELQVNFTTREMSAPLSFRISDMQGKLLIEYREERNKNNSYAMKTGNLPSGLYFLEILQGERVLHVEKLIRK